MPRAAARSPPGRRAASISRAAIPDPAVRQEAEDFVALVTPIVKALMTDLGSEAANLGMQVLGGHGYIREHGMEQYVRDCRIAQIYEGDQRHPGARSRRPQAARQRRVACCAGSSTLCRTTSKPTVRTRRSASSCSRSARPSCACSRRRRRSPARGCAIPRRRARRRPTICASSASPRWPISGPAWPRSACRRLGADDPDGFYAAKVATARFYMQRLLPQTSALFASIMAGGKSMMAFEEAAF